MKNMNELVIAVAGTGYVGLSIATLLSQHNKVYAVDIIEEKVNLINNRMKKNTFKYFMIASMFAIIFSSCATQKKYGCPQHISITKLLGL